MPKVDTSLVKVGHRRWDIAVMVEGAKIGVVRVVGNSGDYTLSTQLGWLGQASTLAKARLLVSQMVGARLLSEKTP